MNSSTLTLTVNTRRTSAVRIPARIGRLIARKADLFAVVSLLASSAAYAVLALTQMTGF